MRSLKLIISFLAVSLIGLQAMAQLAEPKGTDELLSIACNAEVKDLKLTGKPIADLALANLAKQKEARIAAGNVAADRLRALQDFPPTRRLRSELDALADGCPALEGRKAPELAIVRSYTDDPLSGLFVPGWAGGLRPMKKGDTIKVEVPKAPPGVGFAFVWCVGVPEAGSLGVEVDGDKRKIKCAKAKVASTGLPAKAGQTLTLTAEDGAFIAIWLFAEGGRFGFAPGYERLPGITIPPIPGPAGMGVVLAAAKSFEHRKALTSALFEIVKAIVLLERLDVIHKLLEECVALGKDIPTRFKVSIPCDAPGRAAIAGELVGFYSIFAGERFVFGRPHPDKPFQQDAEEVCQVLLDTAIGKRLVGGKTSPELRWASSQAFMGPVRLRREGILEFLMLCPEKRLLVGDDRDEWLQGNRRKFINADARIPFAIDESRAARDWCTSLIKPLQKCDNYLKFKSPELRVAAATSLARPLADLELIPLLRRLDGLVDSVRLAKLLEELKFPCETNPARADLCKRERVLQELALAAISPDIRWAAGWAMGLLWEEWLRKGERSTIIDLKKSPQVEAREGCPLPYGAFCYALANNAPGSTINWPGATAATIAVLTRHFAGDAILIAFKVPTPIIGFQVTLAFDLGKAP